MEKIFYQKYRDGLADKLKKVPDKKMRREIFNQEKKTHDYKLAEWIKYGRHEEDAEDKLKNIGVERDPDGKIILYHATLAKNIPQIIRDRSLHPPEKTANRAWRHHNEDASEKMEKIYLATEKSAEVIAGHLQRHHGGSAYILEVHVDENNLLPDEDNNAENWLESLSANKYTPDGNTGWGRSCAHKGSITNFKIYKKLEYILPDDRRTYYFNREGSEENIARELEEEIRQKAAEEEAAIGIIPEEFYKMP